MDCKFPSDGNKAPFDFSQASLVFINACFGLAFASIFVAFGAFLTTSKLYLLIWGILPVYLIFIVWRQYHTYYIPLQYYRGSHESVFEEFATLATTAALGLLGISAPASPPLTILFLLIVILLNLFKVRQMRQALQSAPHPQTEAITQIDDLSHRLIVNFWFTVFWFAPVVVNISWLEKHPIWLALTGGITPVFLHLVCVPKAYPLIYPPREPNITSFIQAVAAAWKK